MALTLSPKVERLVEEHIRQGGYTSADEVIQAALDALAELESAGLDGPALDAIDAAEDQIESGQVHDWARPPTTFE